MKDFKFVRFLKEIGKNNLLQAGGKGANLGEMIKAGLPVPEGFVLLVNSYQRFIEYNSLGKNIEKLLAETNHEQPEAVKKATEEIKEWFARGEMPADIKKEIYEIYRDLGEPQVAVRSSATAEDLPGASFAGQYSTYLNVKGIEELYESIKKCWASLWNERAVSYRAKQNIRNEGLAHGVVVQKLVNAEKSGILFTANPVNGRRDEISLNASWGLGEAIVGGEVDPDQWVINKKTGKTVREYSATKEVMTVRKEQGIELIAVEPEKQKQITLNESERRELLDLAVKVENHYGIPQDIEWAFEDEAFYLVQTRPITTLYPMPQPQYTGDQLRIYMNLMMWRQGMSGPITPMGVEFFINAVKNVFLKEKSRRSAAWLKSSGGRIFVDITELLRFEQILSRLRENRIPALFDTEPITFKVLSQVSERNLAELRKHKRPVLRLLFGVLANLGSGIISIKMLSRRRELYGKISPRKAAIKATEFGRSQITALEERRRCLQTTKQKLQFVERESTTIFFDIGYGMIFWLIPPLNALPKAVKIIDKYTGTKDMNPSSKTGTDITDLDKVKRAVHNSVTTEMGLDLLKIAEKLDRAGDYPSPDHPEIRQFLLKYGHRAIEEIDIGVPRWTEEPMYVVDLVGSYMEQKTYREGIDRFYRDREEAERSIKNITSRLREKGARGDAKKVEKLLKMHREMFGYRELPKSILVQGVGIVREVLKEVGEDLKAEGRLDDINDVFFVTIQDINSGSKLQEIAKRNREEYQRELNRTPVPRVMTSTGETVYAAIEDENGDAYRGIPASPGVCEGPVRILKRPEEGDRLKQGEILVTASTNPAWTPLFLRIGGLIMETGAPMSHGPVVAREYGIPAIIGVKEATVKLQDGQMVRINGETGTVEVLSK